MAAGGRLFIGLTFIVAVGTADTVPGPCVQCLCEASSGGPTCVFGTDSGCHDGVCGPFAITYPYWKDADRPTVGMDNRNSVSTYEKCALDPACAQATIQGYMTKFHQDCTGDGLEDCYDYARIHFHGGYGCNKPLNAPNQNALDSCLRRLNVLPPSVDIPDDAWKQGERTTYPAIDVRFGDETTDKNNSTSSS